MEQFNIDNWAINSIFYGSESETQREKINEFLRKNQITELYPVSTCKPSLMKSDIDGKRCACMPYNAITGQGYRVI